MDAAGLHQGVQHGEGWRRRRSGRRRPVRLLAGAERRRQHAGGRCHQRRQRRAADQRTTRATTRQQSAGAVYVYARIGRRTGRSRPTSRARTWKQATCLGFAVALSFDGNTLVASRIRRSTVPAGESTGLPTTPSRTNSGALYVFTRQARRLEPAGVHQRLEGEASDRLRLLRRPSATTATRSRSGSGDEDCLTPGIDPPGCDDDSPPLRGANIWVGAAYVFVRNGNTWSSRRSSRRPTHGRTTRSASGSALSGDGNTLAVSVVPRGQRRPRYPARRWLQPFLILDILNRWRSTGTRLKNPAPCTSTPAAAPHGRHGAYVKAANADAGDEFGSAVALSGDGTDHGGRRPWRGQRGDRHQRQSGRQLGGRFRRCVRLRVLASNDASFTLLGSDISRVRVHVRLWVQGSRSMFMGRTSNAEPRTSNMEPNLNTNGERRTQKRERYIHYAIALAIILVAEGHLSSQVRTATPLLPLKQTAYIKASNAEAYDHFACGGGNQGHSGNSIALSGDGSTMVVGAPYESSGARGVNGNQNDNSLYASGAVYIFMRQGGSWVQQAYIKASNADQSDHFGSSVALSRDGNTMVVAAPLGVERAPPASTATRPTTRSSRPALSTSSRARARTLDAAGVPQSVEHRQGRGTATMPGDGDQFGYSVAVSGDGNTVAVGAISRRQRGAAGQRQPGATIRRSPRGRVRLRRGLARRVGAAGVPQELALRGGRPVRLRGGARASTATRSCPAASTSAARHEPSTVRTTTTRTDPARCTSSRAAAAHGRSRPTSKDRGPRRPTSSGYSVAISDDGNTIAAGAGDEDCLTPGINPPGCDNDSPPRGAANIWVGAAYVFVRSGTTWTEQAFIKANNARPYNSFGVQARAERRRQHARRGRVPRGQCRPGRPCAGARSRS